MTVMTVYARLRAAVREQPRLAARLSLSSVMHALGHAAVAGVAGLCVRALASTSGTAFAQTLGSKSLFFSARDARVIALIGLLAVVVKVVASVVAAHAEVSLAKRVGDRLRLDLLDGWLRLHRLRSVGRRDQGGVPVAQVDMHPAAATAHATQHVADIEQGVTRGIIGRARAILEILPLIALLFVQNTKLALVAAVVAIPFVALSTRARKRLKRELAASSDELDALATASDEVVRHADLWTVFGAEKRVRATVRTLGEMLRVRASRVAALAAATSGANEILAALALVLTACAASAGLFGLDDGALLPFMVVFFLAYKPMRALAESRFALARAEATLDQMAPLLGAREPYRIDAEVPLLARASLVVSSLRVRNVSEPVSFTLAPGEMLAITGSTGSGKTTLVRTLLGLERAESGAVTYAEARIDGEPAGPRTRPFSYVPQDAPVVCDSLAANVALGGEDADAVVLLAALGAAPLARALGDRRLGAGGRALSGGERQLVCIARAFAAPQPIVILDEPTSGLDRETEQSVLRFLERAKKERALILVTHKKAPLALADRIVTLDGTDAPTASDAPGAANAPSALQETARARPVSPFRENLERDIS